MDESKLDLVETYSNDFDYISHLETHCQKKSLGKPWYRCTRTGADYIAVCFADGHRTDDFVEGPSTKSTSTTQKCFRIASNKAAYEMLRYLQLKYPPTP